MKLMELFSHNPEDQKDPDQDIDWLDDLKFYIDNDTDLLTHELFPAILQHEKQKDNDDAYKLYLKPLRRCAEAYCKKFDIQKSHDEIFPTNDLVTLARHIAGKQAEYIKGGNYET